MRKLSFALSALAIAAVTAGVALAADSSNMGSMGAKMNNVFHVNPMTKSGQQGTVTITPVSADKTKVVISITNEPVGAIQPAHIHKGNCEHPGAVIIPLTDVVAGHSMTIVNKPIGQVSITGDSVNIHKSAAQINVYVGCADLHNITGNMGNM
ncbi:MAG: hypothetical protein JO194_04025 [Candidatus Eremiobacteraeota bacterium]|nr:hypothetical protein [Candidatus Eremiobacteraeota bacterium]